MASSSSSSLTTTISPILQQQHLSPPHHHPLTNPSSSSSTTTATTSRHNRRTKSSALQDDVKQTLTPQRKHHKLLKDGSGAEVWPEEVENIFVQGLYRYWESPWATHNRGRSRWRNQFLVDHLESAGVGRTKKQVASHIQVLRNMWKGQPEYHLVAGADELLPSPNASPSLKLEDFDPTTLFALSGSDTDSPLSIDSALVPDYDGAATAKHHHHPILHPYNSATPSPDALPRQLSHYHAHDPQLPVTTASRYPISPYSYPALVPDATASSSVTTVAAPIASPSSGTGLSSFTYTIWTEGMHPISFHIFIPPQQQQLSSFDIHHQQPPSAAIVRLRLAIPSVADTTRPTLHGFTSKLSSIVGSILRCTTRVYTGGMCCESEESDVHLDKTSHRASAFLPESALGRCRWFDSETPTRIVQHLNVDGVPIAQLIYDLDRSGLVPGPAVHFASSENCHVQVSGPVQPHQQTLSSVDRPRAHSLHRHSHTHLSSPYPTSSEYAPRRNTTANAMAVAATVYPQPPSTTSSSSLNFALTQM